MVAGKFLNPKNDLAFKRIFGSEKNKDILIHFLNDILMREFLIAEVTFLKTVEDPEIASLRTSLVDVLCEDEKGNRFVIEMQVAHEKLFEKRALYYAARAYCSQRDKGTEYRDLKDVYLLAVTNFTPFPKKTSWFSKIGLKDLETNEHDIRSLQLFFMQLPLFTKTKADLESMTIREKWAYFFKYAQDTNEEDLEKIIGHDFIIKRAYEELNTFCWSQAELHDYDSADMKRWADASVLEYAYEEGRKKERQQMIQRLLKRNRPIREIIEDLGITAEEITSMNLL
jgi:predicted transposase/invertase (TIGR01784 family)